jgi:hypothetical protein
MTRRNKFNSDNSYGPEPMIPNSFEEHCGFVLHIIIALSSFYYTTWILSFYWSMPLLLLYNSNYDDTSNTTTFSGIDTLPTVLQISPPLCTLIIPLILIILFFAIPMLYGCCINNFSTNNPENGSLFILQDPHTIVPSYVSPITTIATELQRSKDDLFIPKLSKDMQNIKSYYIDPRHWTHPLYKNDVVDADMNNTLPEMCDIDVADINNLIWLNYVLSLDR